MKHPLLTALALSAFLAGLGARAAADAGPWSTYRGNALRTGNTDGKPGPAAPKVLWALKSSDHFIAAPVAHGGRLYVSAFNLFNPSFFGLDTDPGASKRVAWGKGSPLLKLPTVSSPALADGKLVFGEGMHQTDGAHLFCLGQDKGDVLWRLYLPGNLVHLEGAPTIAGGRVYLGGGAAGVLCVDLNRVTLDGKEMDPPAVRKALDQRWAGLKAKYDAQKKKDPFAVPPTEDQLPRAAPVQVWQQGKDRWHVDAPVAVAGDRVLVASAFLDKEKVGDRALFALDARTGKERWRTPLPFNPWGGPALAGDLVVVGGSTIGLAPKLLKGAKGAVAAYDLATGKERWRKDIPAGVVSCVALTDGLAIATATDGKVRAFALQTGERRWIYDGRTPFFAPVAAAGGAAYAGDLKAVVHAIDVKTGAERWKLDVAADPAVQAPGMIYGGPALAGGRLYVATCNLEGPDARRATAVVCIGGK
jgi:outer membrane protein assembly factor BamB